MHVCKRLARIERACYPAELLEASDSISSMLEDGARYCLATLQGRVVGYAIVEDLPEGLYISDLAILPQYRLSRAVWGQLLDWIELEAQASQYIEADCRLSSVAIATRLLNRHGFEVRTTVLPDYLVEGEAMFRVTATRP